MPVARAVPSALLTLLAAALVSACGPSASDAPPSAEAAAAVAALPAPYNTGDVVKGKSLFAQCRSCHTLIEGGADMNGPNLYGLFGRQAGARADYSYSDALTSADFVWSAQHLNDWIAAPRTYLPGTKMSFAGLSDEKDRIDLIAYLKLETGYAP